MIRQLSLLIILITTLGYTGCGLNESTACPDTNCSDYATQAAAQAAYDADPECRGDLDADHDGKACEQFSYSGSGGSSGCPTTAACGCSGKNKSDCGGPCCKWTVGSGCGCS